MCSSDLALPGRPLPALDELCYRIERQMARVEENLASGDEVEVISFLRAHCEGLFEHLQTFGAGVRDRKSVV